MIIIIMASKPKDPSLIRMGIRRIIVRGREGFQYRGAIRLAELTDQGWEATFQEILKKIAKLSLMLAENMKIH